MPHAVAVPVQPPAALGRDATTPANDSGGAPRLILTLPDSDHKECHHRDQARKLRVEINFSADRNQLFSAWNAEVGLPSALHWYTSGFAQRSNIQTTLDIPEELERLSPDSGCRLFADRSQGFGTWIPESKLLTLPSSGGVGLRGRQERILQLGGSLEIVSRPGPYV